MIRRIVSEEDVAAVVRMGQRMHHRSRFARWPVDALRAGFILSRIKAEPTVFACLSEQDGKMVAVLVGEIASDPSVDVRIASSLMLYAEATGIGALHLCRLIRAFEKWAAPQADLVSIDVSGGLEDERLAALLERRMGYGHGGRRVVKEIVHGA